ncbi:MAG: histidine kinase [Fimbriimonadaceae bacterium]|nr:histidine kinase [Chitinophagales bacterium]
MTFQERYKKIFKTKQFRVLLHVGFWSFYLSLPIFQYFAYTTFSNNWIILITVINLIYVAYYYPFAYYVTPKFFNARKMHFFILSLLALYVSFFYLCLYIEKYAVANYTFNEADMGFLSQAVQRQVYYLPEFLQVIIVTAIPLSLKFMRRFYKLQDEKSNLEKLNTNLELNFLKSQLNPHFLFNSLNNIYSLALQKNDKAPEMIIKLSDLMRYMLYECNVEKSDLEKEVTFMKDYIDLEKIRHGENVEIDFIIDGDLKNKKIPPLLLIPFVENAFKHGVNAQFGKSWVKFKLAANATTIQFISENNKPFNGISVHTKPGGIGIENVKKRLELIYPAKHTLHIDEQNSIYKVDLEIKNL